MLSTFLPITLSSSTFMFNPAGASASSDSTLLCPAPKSTRRERQRALAFDRLSSSSSNSPAPICLVERSVFEDNESDEEERVQREQGRLSNDGSEVTLIDVMIDDEKITSSVEVQTPAAMRKRQIQSSWLTHTGLDINDEARNGPAPKCTVEELTAAMDDFFGQSRNSEKTKVHEKKTKVDSRKRKLIEKVRECKWMA